MAPAEVSSEHPVAAALLAFAEAAIGPADDDARRSRHAGSSSSRQGGGGLSAGSRPPLQRQSSSGAGSKNVGWVAPTSDLEILPGRCVLQLEESSRCSLAVNRSQTETCHSTDALPSTSSICAIAGQRAVISFQARSGAMH